MPEQRDPLEQLQRCHRRMEEELQTLEQASAALLDDPSDGGAADAVADVVAFFDRTGPRHTDDEEQSLFPRLTGRPELAGLLAELAAEHRAHDEAHAALRAHVAAWGPNGPGSPDGASELVRLGATFARLYRDHIEREERDLLPAARELAEPDRAAMAAEMESRRGGGRGRDRG